jgi:BirA family transcriptional regulator, biotin operon repressor / biotin---[acetyl-CoA-carboxylase] ligase
MFTGMPGEGARTQGATLHGQRARAALAGTRFADVRWVASTGSTNADVLALARDGAPEGVVVVADHQTAGRGRRDRSWVAPPGGSLLMSVLVRPPARLAGAVTIATAVALAEAVEDVAGVAPGLKWPNDLVLGGGEDAGGANRKLAGILAEADWPAAVTESSGWREPAPHERAAVVVGVGLNVCWPSPRDHGGDAVREVSDRAVALNWVAPPTERPDRVDRVDLLVAFLRRFEHHYGGLVARGADAVMAEWRRRSVTLGRRVRVDLGADDVEGIAVEVTGEGHLVVETDDGGRRTLAVGDVVHLR